MHALSLVNHVPAPYSSDSVILICLVLERYSTKLLSAHVFFELHFTKLFRRMLPGEHFGLDVNSLAFVFVFLGPVCMFLACSIPSDSVILVCLNFERYSTKLFPAHVFLSCTLPSYFCACFPACNLDWIGCSFLGFRACVHDLKHNFPKLPLFAKCRISCLSSM
jgi:hypothetical protein